MGFLPMVGLAALIFTGTIVLLVMLLGVAKSKLVPAGPVKILINDDPEKSPTVSAGSTLLQALAEKKIFLPSACGGGGTCAMCKCQVLEGGGDVLPTEVGHLTRTEQRENVRLACQVKVKQDLKIRVPDEVFSIKKFNCTVRSNDNVATFIKEFILDIDGGETLHFEAGGYIQIDIPPYELDYKTFDIAPEYRGDWDKFDLWRYHARNDEECFRAYSMANHPAEGNRVMLNVRIASPPPGLDVPPGIASSYIFNLKPGDKCVVSGPYGEFFIKNTKREMVYLGGGAGMAPMRSHLFHLFHTEKTRDRKVTFFYGARSMREAFYLEDFQQIEQEYDNFKFVLGLSEPLPEDNWTGPVGFIHQVALETYLKDHPAPDEIEYYLCGPPMMISAVQKMLDSLGVDPKMIAFDSFG
ncbi:MAG: NADH:ubiquinone reductase (Na(+)-transporting) subunit F [bacterium]